jgi:hypothetical protein
MPLLGKKYFITGASGFIGTSVLKAFGQHNFQIWRRNDNVQLDGVELIIHLAGKANDLKTTANSQEYYQSIMNLPRKYLMHF